MNFLIDFQTGKHIRFLCYTINHGQILCLDDLAELDSGELVEFLGEFGIEDEAGAGDIIMAARAHWFADEESADSEDAPAEQDA